MARDFQHEAAIETPKRKAERAARNRARRMMEKKLGAAALAGKQVDHKNAAALDNRPINLRLATAKANNTGRSGKPARMRGK
jgi:hypothetical protein